MINFDESGVRMVPVSPFTMEKKGAKGVSVIGADDKRQITAVNRSYYSSNQY